MLPLLCYRPGTVPQGPPQILCPFEACQGDTQMLRDQSVTGTGPHGNWGRGPHSSPITSAAEAVEWAPAVPGQSWGPLFQAGTQVYPGPARRWLCHPAGPWCWEKPSCNSLPQGPQPAPAFCPRLNKRKNLRMESHQPPLPGTSSPAWGQVSEWRGPCGHSRALEKLGVPLEVC